VAARDDAMSTNSQIGPVLRFPRLAIPRISCRICSANQITFRFTRNTQPVDGYGQRALVEAQISRIRRCIGARLLTRRLESQQREGVIIASLVNLWNSFGKAVCVKTV
jgi:hypothetical protein